MKELIHGLSFQGNTLKILVTTTGYTTAKSLKLDAISGIAGYMLTVIRTEEDFGKMMPQIIEVEIAIPDEVAGRSFTIQNEFVDGPK